MKAEGWGESNKLLKYFQDQINNSDIYKSSVILTQRSVDVITNKLWTVPLRVAVWCRFSAAAVQQRSKKDEVAFYKLLVTPHEVSGEMSSDSEQAAFLIEIREETELKS